MKKMKQNEVREHALRLLSRRDYSTHELAIRLKAASYSPEHIEEALSYLIEHGYLNDAVLCTTLADKYARSGKMGAKKIRMKLRQQGFEEGDIQQALLQFDSDTEYQYALQVANHKFGQLAPSNYHKIARFLFARGFSEAIIYKVLGECDRERQN